MSGSFAHGNPFLLVWLSILTVLADIQVAREVPITIVSGELGESLICHIDRAELVVSRSEDIVVNVLEDRVGDLAIG